MELWLGLLRTEMSLELPDRLLDVEGGDDWRLLGVDASSSEKEQSQSYRRKACLLMGKVKVVF